MVCVIRSHTIFVKQNTISESANLCCLVVWYTLYQLDFNTLMSAENFTVFALDLFQNVLDPPQLFFTFRVVKQKAIALYLPVYCFICTTQPD